MDTDTRESAVNELKNMVIHLARKYDFRGRDFDDLYQVGMMELLNALNHYDSGKGASLSSFAYIWINGGILKYIRENNTIKVGKDVLNFNKLVNNTMEMLTQQNLIVPTTEEVASFLGVDVNEVYKARMAMYMTEVQSSDYEFNEDGKALNIYDYYGYEDPRLNSDYIDLNMAINKLNDDEKKIINMKFFEDQSQQEIAKELGTNQVGVSRRLVKVYSKLKKDLVA